MKNRTEEKEKLWREVFGKKREGVDGDVKKTIRDSQEALDQLNGILHKQNQELFEQNSRELEELEKEIQKDYGKDAFREPVKVAKDQDFVDLAQSLKTDILGQEAAMEQLVQGIHRPFLFPKESLQNIMVLCGPKGVGKQESLLKCAKVLKEKGIFFSDNLSILHLNAYQDTSNEQVFLQDMYQACESRGNFIVVDGVEEANPYYRRRLEEFMQNKELILKKRYVLKDGMLVENQAGLVKQSVDRLLAPKKFLVFLSDLSLKKFLELWKPDIQELFQDRVEFFELSEEAEKDVLKREISKLQEESQTHLNLRWDCSNEVEDYILSHLNQKNGIDSIVDWVDTLRTNLQTFALNEKPSIQEGVLSLKEENLVATFGEKEVILYRPVDSDATFKEIEKSFEQIIGLEEVKEKIRSYQALFIAQQKREEQGLPVKPISMHMLFMGNPGTGKTMIARLLAQYLKGIGLLEEGQLIEVTRADLVAQYVGQTAPLTRSVIDKAKGGVLFIDEAYSLYRGEQDSFGLEAIDTLVKAMEDIRGNLVVILAGYEKEMSEFLTANSGLASRFPNQIHFPDYKPEELEKIAVLEAKKQGYHWSKEVSESLVRYFGQVDTTGNGRFARNLVEKAVVHQSMRLMKRDKAKVDELLLEDFQLESHQ